MVILRSVVHLHCFNLKGILVKKRLIITGLMLLIPCLIKADQGDWSDEHHHFSIDEQKNLFDQKFQNHFSIFAQNQYDQSFEKELDESLFDYKRMSWIYEKVRNVSLIYTVVPLTAALLTAMLHTGGADFESVQAALAISAFLAIPLPMAISAGIYTALAKWFTDEQIEQYKQKLAEHRWKMSYLGQCFTGEQIEQYEQKVQELGLKVKASDGGYAVSDVLVDPASDQSSNPE